MGARDRGRRPRAARRGARGPFRRQGAVVRVAAGWDGGVRRGGSPSAPGDDLDGSSRRGPGRGGRRADAARDVLPSRRREPGLLARDLQGAVGPRRGAGGVGEGGHADVARDVRAPRDRGSRRRRPLERVLVRAPGPPHACVVARGARGGRHPRVDAPRGRWPRRSRSRRSPRRSRRRRGWTRRRSSRSGAGTRWRRRSAPACSSRARCATSSGPRSRCARRRASRARTRRCSSSATRTPTPTRGCSRTPGSSRAATCGGGATSSRRSSGGRRPRGSATPTTCSRGKRGAYPPAPRDWCSCRACRGRWPPSGTGPRAACSTGSRSRTRART